MLVSLVCIIDLYHFYEFRFQIAINWKLEVRSVLNTKWLYAPIKMEVETR